MRAHLASTPSRRASTGLSSASSSRSDPQHHRDRPRGTAGRKRSRSHAAEAGCFARGDTPLTILVEQQGRRLGHQGDYLEGGDELVSRASCSSGTTSTGSVDLWTTSCATLPSSIDVRSERPRVPTTSSPA